ncbi:hypothetical protein [Methyloglobulus sp.]|uniref:hypothetical protein n=1 Tax=Methyloglobulus sp. TaxID=2518622 RepID=UPI0032B77700
MRYLSTKKLLISLAIVATLSVSNSQAARIVLDFEGVDNQASVGNFYNGGSDSNGNKGSRNYGVNFSNASLGVVSKASGKGTGNFANQPSGDTALFFPDGSSATMNSTSGFGAGFSFFYSSAFDVGFVNVYDGLNGTGKLLASLNLKGNYVHNCAGDPNGLFCHWDSVGVSFKGIAKSVDFGGASNQVVFDNVTLGSATPGAETPIPGAFWLLGSGFLGLLKMKRRG